MCIQMDHSELQLVKSFMLNMLFSLGQGQGSLPLLLYSSLLCTGQSYTLGQSLSDYMCICIHTYIIFIVLEAGEWDSTKHRILRNYLITLNSFILYYSKYIFVTQEIRTRITCEPENKYKFVCLLITYSIPGYLHQQND